jgi:hypothetical protein
MTALAPALGLVYLATRAGFGFEEPPIHTNWATQALYAAAGSWVASYVDPEAVVDTSGEIGTLAFYSGRLLRNEFTDMNITTAWIARDGYRERPGSGWIYRVNFYWRTELPPMAPASYTLEGVPQADRGVPDHVVRSWRTSTRWMPDGRLYLRRVPTPSGAAPVQQ